jgi:hypothetical protein
MSFLEVRDPAGVGRGVGAWVRDRDLARVGHDAGTWVRDRDLPRRGREARGWLLHDERGRAIGLVVFSVAISIAMALLATAIVGLVSRRRAAVPAEPDAPEASI